MESRNQEELCNTETGEEETLALQRKRSRRVSFAEITSVHVFDRDEDYETPPDAAAAAADPPSSLRPLKNGSLGFRGDVADSDDSRDEYSQNEDDDDGEDDGKPFFRPVHSPSPRSNFGSASSDDGLAQDDFFGPVSASFIRHGQLSASATSDENHDITLDSTAFTMHLCSLQRTDDAGDSGMSTGVHLASEEKTPTQNTTHADGSSMALTGANKKISLLSVSDDKVIGSGDSNDMSLVGENAHRFDFGSLSPELHAVLAEGSSEDLGTFCTFDEIKFSNASSDSKRGMLDEHETNFTDSRDDGPKNIVNWSASVEASYTSRNGFCKPGGEHVANPVNTTTCDLPSYINDAPTDDASAVQTPNMPSKVPRQTIFSDAAVSSRGRDTVTSTPRHLTSLIHRESKRRGETASSIEKSIFKSKNLDASPNISTPRNGILNSNIRPPDLFCSINDIRIESGVSRNFQTPPRNMHTQFFQSQNPDKNLLTITDPATAKLRKELPEPGISSSTFGSAFSDRLLQSMNERGIQGFEKKSSEASGSGGMKPFLEKEILSSASSQLRNRHGHDDIQGLDSLRARVRMQDSGSSIKLKRSDEQMFHRDDIDMIQSSLKVHKSGCKTLKLPLECSIEKNCDLEKLGGSNTSKNWIDMLAKMSTDANQLLSLSVDKLTLKGIGMLEDIVDHLQKLKVYELLSSEYEPQNSFEVRSLLHVLMHKQAKLKLLSIKRERLQKREHLLRSGIEKSQTFKLDIAQHLSRSERAQMDDRVSQPCSFNFKCKYESVPLLPPECDEVTAMRQELEASEREVKELAKLVQTYCNIKEEENRGHIIESANDHLRRKLRYRLIRQEFQLWDVDDLEFGNAHRSLVLNYHGLLCQRLIVNGSPISSICVTNKLNNTNILKKYPNMDALTAFTFVINAESSHKYVGLGSLTQETQVTSSFLSALLDVVDEVHLSQIEISNLIHASFHSPSVEKLDLELCFADFNNGKKAGLTLDMTNLKSGIYPSEILPSQLEVSIHGSGDSVPQTLYTEIMTNLGGLRAGFMRIVRLCRCISGVIKASGS